MMHGSILTQKINPVYPDNANTRDWVWAQAGMLAVKAA
jgi:hypothetical protein